MRRITPSRAAVAMFVACCLGIGLIFVFLPYAPQAAASASAGTSPSAADQNSGAYATSIPIETPSFHGIEPHLSLAYNSSAGNGAYGLGWQLAGESSIERTSPRRGAPTFAATDVYSLDGEPLVASTILGGAFVTKRQSYRRIGYVSATNTWTVVDTNGTRRVYAATFNPIAGKTARWMLSSVVDRHGNTVNYAYWCDGAKECYLKTVSYNGTVVTLYRESRPDVVTLGVGGAMSSLAYRIKTIDVMIGEARARAYALSYSVSTTTGRSLLTSVRHYGRDAALDSSGTVTGGTALPPARMSYSSDVNAFTGGALWKSGWCRNTAQEAWAFGIGDVSGDGRDDAICLGSGGVFGPHFTSRFALSNGSSAFTGGATAAQNACGAAVSWQQFNVDFHMDTRSDVNGDGRSDILCQESEFVGDTWVHLSNGSGGLLNPGDDPAPVWRAKWCVSPATVGTGDFNGDGKTDIYCHDSGTWNTRVALSNGASGFAGGGVWLAGWCGSGAAFGTADFNGDGRSDIWCHAPSTGNNYVALSNGVNAFSAGTLWRGSWCSTGGKFGVGDFNGDGRSDIWCHVTSTAANYVALSNGTNQFTGVALWKASWCSAAATFGVADINGDGRSDIWCHLQSTGDTWVATSNGIDAFTGTSVWKAGWCKGTTQHLATGDFDGNGKTDLVCYDLASGSMWVAVAGNAGRADLLTGSVSELGAVTTITYRAATAWANTLLPPGRPPMVVWQLNVNSGSGPAIASTFGYVGGTWDPVERRFLGFRQVIAADPVGAAVTTTTFRLMPGYPTNRPSLIDRTDSGGVLLARTQIGYTESVAAGVHVSQMYTTIESSCAGASVCQPIRSNFEYDGYGNVVRRLDYGDTAVTGDERTTMTGYAYDTVNYLVNTATAVTVRRGIGGTGPIVRQSTFGYNVVGDVTSTGRLLIGATNTVVTTSAGYDSYGNRVSSTDERGKTTTYAYDSTHHIFLIKTCNPLAQCSTQGWDGVLGVVTSATDLAGQVTSRTYDALGRQTGETRPDSSTTTTAYASTGQPNVQYRQETVSDGTADGLWTRTYLDGLGRTTKTVREPDITVLTTYNAQGLVASVSNPFRPGQTAIYTTYGYDPLGRQTKVTHPDNTTRTTTYSVTVNASDAYFAQPRRNEKRCDEAGACRRVAYDGNGNIVLTSEWNGTTEYRTTANYDEVGNLLSVKDAAGNVMSQTWDSLGRKQTMKDPDAGSLTYGYDAAGHLTSQTDARGVTITMAYDAVGRLTVRSAGSTVLSTNHYDQAGHGAGGGRLTSITDPSGSTSFSYDSLGRVITTAKTIGSSIYTVQEAFDKAGRRASLTYPGGEVVGYTYDASGCLSTVGTYVIAATCTTNMDLATRTLGNGAKETNTYDPKRLWLTADTITTSAGAVLQSETYGHNARGQIVSKTSTDTADQWAYSYDPLGRLTGATNTTTAAYSSSYAYDAVGRMTSGTGIGTLTYPAAGSARPHAPTAVGATAYSYDAAGNRTNDGTSSYTYDQVGRLATSTTAGTTTSYTYDGQNHRVKAGTTTFVAVGGQLLYQTNGTVSSKFYYYGEQRVARRDSTGSLVYYAGDHLGSPHLILSSTAAVARTSIFSPYGAVLSQTGSASDPFGLNGRYKDASGLYKLGHRYLSPKTAAFLTPDVSGAVDVSAPQTLNRYAYACNDPINMVDPSGEKATNKDGADGELFSMSYSQTGQLTFSVDLQDLSLELTLPHNNEPGAFSYGVEVPILGDFGGIGIYHSSQFQNWTTLKEENGGSIGVSIPYVIDVSGQAGLYRDRSHVDAYAREYTIGVHGSLTAGVFGLPAMSTDVLDASYSFQFSRTPNYTNPFIQSSSTGTLPYTNISAGHIPGFTGLTNFFHPFGSGSYSSYGSGYAWLNPDNAISNGYLPGFSGAISGYPTFSGGSFQTYTSGGLGGWGSFNAGSFGYDWGGFGHSYWDYDFGFDFDY